MIYSFDNIYGNEKTKSLLQKLAKNDTPAHACIIEGAFGSGKKLLANSYAKMLFCETKKNGCRCHSCVQYDAGSHSDLILVSKNSVTKKSQRSAKPAKSIGIDVIRELILSELHKKPFEYERKIFIIDNAELMTTEAQNALLRSLEEPPPYAVFILLSQDRGALLETLLSRAVTYKTELFSHQFIINHLKSQKNEHHTPEKAEAATAYCAGTIGRALSLLENESFFEIRRLANEAVSGALLKQLGLFELLEYNQKIVEIDSECAKIELFEIVSVLLRDIMTFKALTKARDISLCNTTKTDSQIYQQIFQQDYLEIIALSARNASYRTCYLCVEALIDMKKALLSNTPLTMAFDAFLVKLHN